MSEDIFTFTCDCAENCGAYVEVSIDDDDQISVWLEADGLKGSAYFTPLELADCLTDGELRIEGVGSIAIGFTSGLSDWLFQRGFILP